MKRPLKPDERHIWGMVAATVHPLPGRERCVRPSPPEEGGAAPAGKVEQQGSGSAIAARPRFPGGPQLRPGVGRHDGEASKPIEPNRRHRIAKAREEIGARLDLHGLDQDRARARLDGFLARAWDEGFRAVLVITGKGVQGDGVLKRRAPEWLAAPHLAHIVAGIADAARHHGGEGALYVALKRKTRS